MPDIIDITDDSAKRFSQYIAPWLDAEAEACAKICEQIRDTTDLDKGTAEVIAIAIRGRIWSRGQG
jgi:hypothetical protein